MSESSGGGCRLRFSFTDTRKAGNRNLLRIKGLNQRDELCDDEQILKAMIWAEQSDVPIYRLHGSVTGNEFSQPTAIHVRYASQVQKQLTSAGIDGCANTNPELRVFLPRQIPCQVQDGDIVKCALVDDHSYRVPFRLSSLPKHFDLRTP